VIVTVCDCLLRVWFKRMVKLELEMDVNRVGV
jgi:hypothetical protein